MDEWCAEVGSRPLSWAKWTEGIYPDYRALAEKSVRADSVKLHEYAARILSSQAFAFNLFLPFREGSRERLSQRFSEIVGARLTIERVNSSGYLPAGCSESWMASGLWVTNLRQESTWRSGAG